MSTLTINLAQSTSDLISACRHRRGEKEKRKTKHHNFKCSKLDSILTGFLKTKNKTTLQP